MTHVQLVVVYHTYHDPQWGIFEYFIVDKFQEKCKKMFEKKYFCSLEISIDF